MRKRWLVVGGVVLIGGAAVAAPYYSGAKAQAEVKEGLAALSKQAGVQARLVRYDRRWFGASAESVLEYQVPEGETIRIHLDHEIRHGPTYNTLNLATVTTTLRLPEKAAEHFEEIAGQASPLTVVNGIQLNGGHDIELRSPAFELRNQGESGVHVEWQGAKAHADVSSGADTFDFELSMPGLRVTEDGKAEVVLEDITASSASRKDSEYIWLGDGKIEVARFYFKDYTAQDPAAAEGEINDLTLSAGLSKDDDLLTYAVEYKAKTVTTQSKTFRQPSLGIELRRLDYEAVSDVVKQLQATTERGASPEEAGQIAGQALAFALPRLLKRSPEVAVSDLTVETANGKVQGSGRVRYVGSGGLQDLQHLKRDLKGEAELVAPKATVEAIVANSTRVMIAARSGGELSNQQVERMAKEMAAGQLQQLVGQGLLVEDGGRYRVQMKLEDQTLVVNGNPMPL